MITHRLEIFADLLNIGVNIDTNTPDELNLEFWVRNESTGASKNILETESNLFREKFVKPFSEVFRSNKSNADVSEVYQEQLFMLTHKKYDLDENEIEEFQDFMVAIAAVVVNFENKKLPWQ